MSIQQKFEHGGNLYAAMRDNSSTQPILDYSANINPLGLSDLVRKAIYENIDNIVHYPDTSAYELKNALSRYYDVPTNFITPGNGAVELMYILCHTLQPKKVLVTAPTFSEYERAALAAGASMEYITLSQQDEFAINMNQIIEKLNFVDVVFIGNPNNPTGTLLKRVEIERLIIEAQKCSTFVVVDESFLDFLIDDSEYSCRRLIGIYDNLIITQSLTKFYAIPGLRLGFALAGERITKMLHDAKDPWNVNSLAQAAGVWALQDAKYQQESKKLMAVAKQEFYDMIKGVKGLRAFIPAVNFMLVCTEDIGITAPKLRALMFKRNILIRDCSQYPGLSPYFIRLAVKRSETNQIVVKNLQEIVGENT